MLRLLGSGVCNRTARLTLPSGLRSWVLRANPLFEFLMHLVGFDTLFGSQQLINLADASVRIALSLPKRRPCSLASF